MMNDLEKKIREKEEEIHEMKSGKTQVGYLSEDQMLADFMTWARNTYPDLRKAIFHIENEGDSSSDHARFKGAQSLSKGKLAGVFDVCSVYYGKLRFAEFKLPSGRLSEKQQDLWVLWTGWYVSLTLIKTFDDWKYWIEKLVLKDRI